MPRNLYGSRAPFSKMVRVMPTETKATETQPASPIIAPQQETIVLTACMRSKDVREDVLPMLIEDDFVKSDHRTLFKAIRAMHEADYPIDEVSLLDFLKSSRMLDAAGGEKAVLRMFESDMPLLSWQTAYDRLIDVSKRRSLDMAMNEIEAKAYETPPDMKAFVSKIESSLAQVTERRNMRPYQHISSFLGAAVDEAHHLDNAPFDSTVVNTGFATLDEMLAGLRAGQLIVVGARPAVGKTSFALTLALNAVRQDVKVGIFSLEMSGKELAQRIICAELGYLDIPIPHGNRPQGLMGWRRGSLLRYPRKRHRNRGQGERDDRGHLRNRRPHAAWCRARLDRHRLSPAHFIRVRWFQVPKPRSRGRRDKPLAQGACQGTRRPRRHVGAVEPPGRIPSGSASPVGLTRVRINRTGRRYRPVPVARSGRNRGREVRRKAGHPIGREKPKRPYGRYRHAVRPDKHEILRGWT